MSPATNLRCSQCGRSCSNKSNLRRHLIICISQLRRRIRRNLEESRKREINKKMQNESKTAVGGLTQRRNSLPDMPNIMDDADAIDKNGSLPPMDGEFKQERKQEEVIALPSNERNNAIAELNKRMLSSNDLQKLNEQNKELNNNLDEYIVEQKHKFGTESVISDRSAPKIGSLMRELSKALEIEKSLRSQNAELIRSKAVLESQSQDLSRKLEVTNQCSADYKSQITKLTTKNTELETQCAKLLSEVDEMRQRSLNEKAMDDKRRNASTEKSKHSQKLSISDILVEHLDPDFGELTMTKIRHYELNIIKREKTLSAEIEQLHSDKKHLENGFVELATKFEKYQERQDNYVRQLDNDCSTRIASMLTQKRSLETQLSAMENRMRFMNEVLKRNKIDISIFVQGKGTPTTDHGCHHRSAKVNLKALAEKYNRKTNDSN